MCTQRGRRCCREPAPHGADFPTATLPRCNFLSESILPMPPPFWVADVYRSRRLIKALTPQIWFDTRGGLRRGEEGKLDKFNSSLCKGLVGGWWCSPFGLLSQQEGGSLPFDSQHSPRYAWPSTSMQGKRWIWPLNQNRLRCNPQVWSKHSYCRTWHPRSWKGWKWIPLNLVGALSEWICIWYLNASCCCCCCLNKKKGTGKNARLDELRRQK